MDLLSIKIKIFQDLGRPVKCFFASQQADNPMAVEYYAGKDYEQLFEAHLYETLSADKSAKQQVIDELNSGAIKFAQKVMLALYSQWSTAQLPRAIKKIANYSGQYPYTSELLMSFYERHVASVDVVNDFGESALAMILRGNTHPKTRPLLFLMSHGAKHSTLSSAMQDSLMLNAPELYEQADSNTSSWMRTL